MKHIWYERNNFIKDFIPAGSSIVDFGCGQREILDFITPSDYIGIDQNKYADIHHNLNKPLVLDKEYDIGLWLGVLEYLRNPGKSLYNQKDCAKTFIVLTLNVTKKQEWVNAYTKDSINELLCSVWLNVQHFSYERYTLSVCNELFDLPPKGE